MPTKTLKNKYSSLLLICSCLTLFGCTKHQEKHEHNIGFIDPETALGPPTFKVCDSLRIFEYYNSYPHAGYKYGKNKLREVFNEKFKKVSNDYGYFTIRFIINCQGSAGRYEIIENDLNFKEKTFSEDIKNQLFEITSNALTEWNPLILDGNPRDSYIYLMFRIEDGEITEILP